MPPFAFTFAIWCLLGFLPTAFLAIVIAPLRRIPTRNILLGTMGGPITLVAFVFASWKIAKSHRDSDEP